MTTIRTKDRVVLVLYKRISLYRIIFLLSQDIYNRLLFSVSDDPSLRFKHLVAVSLSGWSVEGSSHIEAERAIMDGQWKGAS